MGRTKKTSVARRGFLKGAAAFVATAPSAVSQNTPAQAAQDWLSLTQEAPLEPELPIIDPHDPLWDDPARTPRRYLLAPLAPDTRGHKVRPTSVIEYQSVSPR